MNFTVSCLASASIFTGRDCTAFSSLDKISSIDVVRGVTSQLRPFFNNEYIASSIVWPLRLMTVSFEVSVGGYCVLWSRKNFALLSSPTRVAFSNVSWSIRD